MVSLLRRGLVEEGHAVDVARTGDDALALVPVAAYDAIVLDLMLPGIDGFEVCRRLRAIGVWAPVLMLTARDAVEDRVAGPRRGRRRLPAEAVLVRRAARAPARARPTRDAGAAGAARGRRPAPRPRDASGVACRRRRSRSPPRSSRCSRRSCVGPAWSCRASSSSSTRGTTRSRTGRTSSTSTSATCARRSTGRSAGLARDGARRRLPAAEGRGVSRVPIRLRLTLAFALAMAVVLAVAGVLVYVRLDASLTEQLDESLDARAAALAPLARSGEPLPRTGDERAGGGRSPAAGSELVSADEVARALDGPIVVERDEGTGVRGRARAPARSRPSTRRPARASSSSARRSRNARRRSTASSPRSSSAARWRCSPPRPPAT